MKHSTSYTTVGAGLVALSSLGYSTNPILGKIAFAAGANAITLGAGRFTIAAILLWLLVAFRSQNNRLAFGERLRLFLMGMLGFAMVALVYFTALGFIDASLATGLFYTYPAMVTLFGAIRGQGLSSRALVGLLLTSAGTWMLLGAGFGGFTWSGAALILLAAAWYSAYVLVSDRWTRGIEPVVVSAHVCSGAAVVYLGIALATGQAMLQPKALLAAGGLAVLSTVLALVTFFAGLVRVGSIRASIISTLEAVFTALLAVVALGETLSLIQAAGIGLVMVGAVASQIKESASASVPEQA